MVEKNLLNDLEADLQELASFQGNATRPYVRCLMEKEMTKLKDIILIEKNKIIQKAPEEKKDNLDNEKEEVVYLPIKNYSFEQENKTIKVYITLDGVGDIDKSNISCVFDEHSFDLKIRNYKNQNMRFTVKKLNDVVDKDNCKFIIKKNSIHITLTKKDSKHWDNLYWKESPMKVDKPEAPTKQEDPQESLMNMMKKLYQEGDDEMKKTIAQAWTKSQDEKDKKKI